MILKKEKCKQELYLIGLFVKKNLTRKYKGSYLGVLWSLLSPLLNMIVLTIVFSTLFRNSIENFTVYLLSGRLVYEFFASDTKNSTSSIISNAGLIKKIYIPKYIFIISKTLSNFITFLISLIDLAILMAITGVPFTINILFAPLYLILLLIFVSGLSFIISTMVVFFRDIEHLYTVALTALMYLSCLFYPVEIIPGKFKLLVYLNPIYYYISGFRNVVYGGNFIEISNIIICLGISVITFCSGIIILKKNENKFILHI